MTKIYVLVEPNCGEIRYIGKTVKPLSARLNHHFFEARNGVKNHRCNWIRFLFSKGYLPKIQLIGEIEGDGCKEEIAWIKYFRDEGLDLVNETDGGDGTVGHKHSEDTRFKMSEIRKRYYYSDENRRKTSQAILKSPLSLISRLKTSEFRKGKHHKSGYKFSKKACQKISLAMKGKPWSEKRRHVYETTEQRKTPEHRKKISDSLLRYYQSKKEI